MGNPPDQIDNFERYGVILLEWQLKLAFWAREADKPTGPNEIGSGGARGPGKSFANSAIMMLDDCVRYPGLTFLYLRQSLKAGKQQLGKLISAVLGQVEKVSTRRAHGS